LRRAALAQAARTHFNAGNLRVAALALCLASVYLAFGRGLFSAWWLFVPAAALGWTGRRLDRAVNARTRLERAVAFYESALSRLDGKWSGTGSETGARFLDDTHLYAADLDLFGPASMFELLNSARTSAGEDTLAGWLKAPAEPAIVSARQDAVADLTSRTDLREAVAVLGRDARTRVDAGALAGWGEGRPLFDAAVAPAALWILSAAGLVGFALLLVWVAASTGAVRLGPDVMALMSAYVTTMLLACGGVAWRFHSRTTRIFGVDAVASDLRLLSDILGRFEAEPFTSPRLAALRTALRDEDHSAARRIAGLQRLVDLVHARDHFVVRIAGLLVLSDVHLAYAIDGWRRRSGPAVREWLAALGELEALVSFGGYAHEHPADVFPDLSSRAIGFDAEGLAHPLIADAVNVPNDVRLVDPLRVLVVSGSNMSGKSTLLRAVGVNAVLAQAGAPVRARRLQLEPLAIGASIQLHDSLQAGVSRFYAEITRLGEIMRRAGGQPRVLFLIDELLHGTNSYDRGIGAEAIVRGLIDRGAIGLVTTHDLALAGVAEALAERGANVHFEDSFSDGRMSFDYRMRPGVVQHSNAVALMRSVGLEI
jgi:hypothetical protein